MAKKNKKSGAQRRKKLSDNVYETLQTISDLIEKDDFDNAYNLLAPLERKYPMNDEIWEERAHFFTNLGEISEAWWSAYRALQLNSENRRVLTNIIYLSTQLMLPWATQYYIEQYMTYAVFMPPQLAKIREDFDELNEIQNHQNPETKGKKLAELALIDFARQLANHSQITEAMTVCLRALKIFPNLRELQQIMSVLLMSQGKLDKAIDYLEEKLSENPNDVLNAHLLSQFYYMFGDVDKAEKIYDDLKLTPPSTIPEYIQRFQLLAMLDKTDEILPIYQAYLVDHPESDLPDGIFHFVVVATALSGNTKDAKKMWKGMVDTSIAIENLNDLNLPISQQKGVSYFELSYIMPVLWIDLLSQPAKTEAQIKQRIDKLFKDGPWIENLINILLQRGDEESHEFVHYICTHRSIPSLYDYATGTKGSDMQRLSVLKLLIKHGEVTHDNLPEIMINGDYQIPELFRYKINYEPTLEDVPKHIQNKLNLCYELLSLREWYDAIDLIQETRTLLPDSRTLMNYEVTALRGLGEHTESDEILDDMVKKFPDYHFTRMDKARRLIDEKQFDEAQEWIAPVEATTEFHISELRIYAITKIEWFIARGENDMARNWLHQLEAIAPHMAEELIRYHSKLSVKDIMSAPIFKNLFKK